MIFAVADFVVLDLLDLPHTGGYRWRHPQRLTLMLSLESVVDGGDRSGATAQGSLKIMLGKLSIIGAVAAILVIPTALSAQMGGAVNPGVHVGGAVNPGATVRGAVERGIPGPDLGTWRSPSGEVRRSRKHTATKPRR